MEGRLGPLICHLYVTKCNMAFTNIAFWLYAGIEICIFEGKELIKEEGLMIKFYEMMFGNMECGPLHY
ncbi:hypothetical protein VNO77_10553 [Canavalia gladiata]|uniref:Uncharacterized protein n=1 Tax=Canavalia gladiata TaxID=3824 RepID=A0AAN9MH18_CANGL